MMITRWHPCREITLHQQLYDVFAALAGFEQDFGQMQVPSIELRDTNEAVILNAWLPGIDPGDLDIQVTPEAVILSGEHRSGRRSNYNQTFQYRNFRQAIALPTHIQSDRAQADFTTGRLTLTLPKTGQAAHPQPTTQQLYTVSDWLKSQQQNLTQSWTQIKHWLGHQLQTAADRLLDSPD
ncbi:MAG: Hsp20/alpha crystallin family protein [Cyanothece sp. SIO1E1]|nr:Hsp20/alpha crystallin family protein [Cyanothece sp. SIO1E1]